jgi:hypothetical protein
MIASHVFATCCTSTAILLSVSAACARLAQHTRARLILRKRLHVGSRAGFYDRLEINTRARSDKNSFASGVIQAGCVLADHEPLRAASVRISCFQPGWAALSKALQLFRTLQRCLFLLVEEHDAITQYSAGLNFHGRAVE